MHAQLLYLSADIRHADAASSKNSSSLWIAGFANQYSGRCFLSIGPTLHKKGYLHSEVGFRSSFFRRLFIIDFSPTKQGNRPWNLSKDIYCTAQGKAHREHATGVRSGAASGYPIFAGSSGN